MLGLLLLERLMVNECYGELGHWVSEVLWYEKNGQISLCGMVFI